MPARWSMVDSSFPTFKGDEKPREQINELINYMYILVEELKYQLENLDANNWNDTALKDFQTDTTADISLQMTTITANLAKLTSEVANLSSRLNAVESLSGRMNQAETEIAFLEKDAEAQATKMGEMEEAMSSLETQMDMVHALMDSDGTGGGTVGNPGKDLHLVGNVYINGKLYEEVTQ